MPADYPNYVLAEMATEGSPDGPGVGSAALTVQIHQAFAELSVLADQQPDKWQVLVLLNRAVESLRGAMPGDTAAPAQRPAGERTVPGAPRHSAAARRRQQRPT
jgi:hypothetical protein